MQSKKEIANSVNDIINSNIRNNLPKKYQIWLIAGSKSSLESIIKVLIKCFYFDKQNAVKMAIKAINGTKILCYSVLKDSSETKMEEIDLISKTDFSIANFIFEEGLMYIKKQ